ncbi:Hypothetical_protein [Hexamita inflata]|uniref:Hypothetical_protein n=1 Tax=Hexamita inflata TaxID=28002 RepID=A0ABP1KIV4_9EUKA
MDLSASLENLRFALSQITHTSLTYKHVASCLYKSKYLSKPPPHPNYRVQISQIQNLYLGYEQALSNLSSKLDLLVREVSSKMSLLKCQLVKNDKKAKMQQNKIKTVKNKINRIQTKLNKAKKELDKTNMKYILDQHLCLLQHEVKNSQELRNEINKENIEAENNIQTLFRQLTEEQEKYFTELSIQIQNEADKVYMCPTPKKSAEKMVFAPDETEFQIRYKEEE